MWLRDPIDIEVSRSANIPIGMQFWDDYANAPMDITGYQFSLFIAVSEGAQPFASAPVELTDPVNGNVDFIIMGSYFNSLAGTQDTVSAAYHLKAEDVSGNSVIAARGALIVTPGIVGEYSEGGTSAIWASEEW